MLVTYLVNVYFLRFETVIYIIDNLLLHLLVALESHCHELVFLIGAKTWVSELEKAGVSV